MFDESVWKLLEGKINLQAPDLPANHQRGHPTILLPILMIQALEGETTLADQDHPVLAPMRAESTRARKTKFGSAT